MLKMWNKLCLIFSLFIAVALSEKLAIEDRSENANRISPEIVNELKDFRTLIPDAVIDEVVAKHMLIDSGFRRALKFVRSNAFKQMMQQAEQVQEVATILEFLHLTTAANANALASNPMLSQLKMSAVNPGDVAGNDDYNEVDVDAESPHLKFVLLEEHPRNRYAYHVRSFSTFIEELLDHLPHDKFVQLINKKRQKSAAFASFYAALKSIELRPLVDAAIKSKNLSSTVSTLKNNDIDVNSLKSTAFQVIAWGPNV